MNDEERIAHQNALDEWNEIEAQCARGIVITEETLQENEEDNEVIVKRILQLDCETGNEAVEATVEERRLWLCFRSSSRRHSAFDKQLDDERIHLIALSSKKYTHCDVLWTALVRFYRQTLPQTQACPRVGPHWQQVGFQGTDPSTDLNRGTGVFGLLQLFVASSSDEWPEIARESQNTQNLSLD